MESNAAPKFIIAHYDTTCPECGIDISEGDDAYWLPTNRRLYCVECGEELNDE